MPEYIGKWTCCYSIGGFLSLSIEKWLSSMSENYHQVTPYKLEESQIKAWKDSFNVLRHSLVQLPEAFKDLNVIFEYVLPCRKPGTNAAESDNGIRADAIILSRKTACVLEFKQRDDVFIGHVKQAKKYRKRVQDYHVQSIGMNKKAILILTQSTALFETYRKVTVCSPDTLAETIQLSFEDNPERNNVEGWLNSEFKVRD